MYIESKNLEEWVKTSEWSKSTGILDFPVVFQFYLFLK